MYCYRLTLLTLINAIVATSNSVLGQPVVWTNPTTGAAAGAWSSAANWSPATVPTSSNTAQISNGGEAHITANVVASRIEVGKNNGIGTLTSNTPGVQIIVDSDFDIGEIGGDFATGAANVTSNGTAAIAGASLLLVGDGGSGDLDIGQSSANISASANSHGVLTLDSITQVQVFDDTDVGQAGGSANSTANAELHVFNVGSFQIGADLDIGQAGGTGIANSNGAADFRDSQITVGASVDVGRTSGSAVGNSGNGTLELVDSTLTVGFADPLTPGSLRIGDAAATLDEIANGAGTAKLTRSTLEVADRISVGGLSGAGANVQNSSSGSLTLTRSTAIADRVRVAVMVAPTVGVATGSLTLDSSLLSIASDLVLGSSATLEFALGGTLRADGTNSNGQYGAIDAATASLDGQLVVSLSDGYSPAVGDQFDLIRTTGLITGSFSLPEFPQLTDGLGWQLAQTDSLLQLTVITGDFDGDFNADGDVDGQDFLTWQRNNNTLSGVTKSQGDADLDGDVDQHDLAVWQATLGTNISSPLFAAKHLVPEPHTAALLLSFVATAVGLMRNHRENQFTGVDRR